MANVAVIFAGGTGTRMNLASRPKQFLEHRGKPILIYTLDVFERHPEIDAIVLVMLKEWLPYTEELVERFELKKVRAIVPGGDSALSSQLNGLNKASELFGDDVVVLIHDGVRPLISADVISRDIATVKAHGSAITTAPAIETVVLKGENGEVGQIIERSRVEMARAPQCFYLKDILKAHAQAREDGLDFIDSASMMQHYGHTLYTVSGSRENIKITTPNDFHTFQALIDSNKD